MLALVAPTAWAFDAGHTAEPMLAATATNTTAETIPIMRRGENRMTGCRVGGRWAARCLRGSSQASHTSTYAAAG